MANDKDVEMSELRRHVRACIKEAVGDSAGTDIVQTDTPKKPSLNVSVKPDATLQSSVVDITKAAAYGLERMELLKKRDFPTHKSANAVSTAMDVLELIFQDMLKNPMGYLDEDPVEKVAAYEKSLDKEEELLSFPPTTMA